MVAVWPASAWHRHLSICHQRSLMATVLSWLTPSAETRVVEQDAAQKAAK